jgi:CTP:molybdopterin cytidylyltransferase MocA
LDYHGQPWLVEQLRRFKAASGKRVIIVLGFHQAQYFDQIPWLQETEKSPVHQLRLEIATTINPAPEQGQFSSLQQAIVLLQTCEKDFSERRTPNAERYFSFATIVGAFILPIDVPCPGKEVFEKLTGAFNSSIDAVIPQYQSKGGHPVLLSAEFLRRLAEVLPSSPNARLDFQIQALSQDQMAFVSVEDKRVCLNMNTLEEFRSFINPDGSLPDLLPPKAL